MDSPYVSVIIPTYNGSDYLIRAIQSILDQSYPHFEIIVVDDASPDDVTSLIKQLGDPRVKYQRHLNNRGAVAARHSGIAASSGEILAFLDQDDQFHLDKLKIHVDYLMKHPDIGASYNASFKVWDSVNEISGLWWPPEALKLDDFVLGFPISPGDIVLRREWALLDEIWDDSFASEAEHIIFNGQEIVFGGRLIMAGCKIGNVGRALNYRRLHSQRKLKNLEIRCKSELACQELIFTDPRCPPEVIMLRDIANSNIYLMWAFTAFRQDEGHLGNAFLKKSIEKKPLLLDQDRLNLLNAWIARLAMENPISNCGHESMIHTIFNNLPSEFNQLIDRHNWAVAQSYLFKGMHAVIWGKPELAEGYFSRANQMGAEIDEWAVKFFISKLKDFEIEFGIEESKMILHNLESCLGKAGYRHGLRNIRGSYWVNKAFQEYRSGEFALVPASITHSIRYYPKFLVNRGVISIFLRSLINLPGFRHGGKN